MHIVHCLTHSIHGGGQAVPYLLIKNLLQLHPEVRHTVILPSDGIYVERFKELNVHVIEFPFNKLRFTNFLRIKSILYNLSPDVIHTHGRGAGLYIRLFSKTKLSARRIHTHHGFHMPENKFSRLVFTLFENSSIRNTDVVISVSNSEAEIIRMNVRTALQKIKVIVNVIDKERTVSLSREQIPQGIESLIKEFDNSFVVIMIGRDDSVKNYVLAFGVMKKILEKSRDIIFVLVGVDPFNSEVLQIKKNYPHNCHALGYIENPLPILSRSSVLLMTSKREGAPMSVLEAFALAKPVVGTNVRGINDYVQHEENGLLVEENVSSVANAIMRLKSDSRLYNKLSDVSIQFSENQSVAKWAEQYYSTYMERP